MGGTMEVNSVFGQGSTFTFNIPTTETWNEECEKGNDEHRTLELEEQSFSSIQVLVAEDDEANQKVISKMLKRLGCKHQVHPPLLTWDYYHSHASEPSSRAIVKPTTHKLPNSWQVMERKQWRWWRRATPMLMSCSWTCKCLSVMVGRQRLAYEAHCRPHALPSTHWQLQRWRRRRRPMRGSSFQGSSWSHTHWHNWRTSCMQWQNSSQREARPDGELEQDLIKNWHMWVKSSIWHVPFQSSVWSREMVTTTEKRGSKKQNLMLCHLRVENDPCCCCLLHRKWAEESIHKWFYIF